MASAPTSPSRQAWAVEPEVEYEDAVDVPLSAWQAAGLPAQEEDPGSKGFAVTEAPPSEEDALPLWWIVLLALPQLSMTSLTLLLNVHLLSHYSRLGASLQIMTLFITIARSTDAITDPAASWLTDSGMLQLCWRPGVRRKPFMLIGPWVYDVAMVLLLGAPIDFGENGTMWAVWYGAMQTLFYIGDTLCSIPLAAMMPAMSTNNRTRERVFMWARGVNSLGILIAALAPVPLGWMLRSDRCYDTRCAPCPLGSNMTLSALSADAFSDCQSTCQSMCDLEGSTAAFRYIGWFFAVWHFVTMYIVILLVPEPGLEMSLFRAKQARRAGVISSLEKVTPLANPAIASDAKGGEEDRSPGSMQALGGTSSRVTVAGSSSSAHAAPDAVAASQPTSGVCCRSSARGKGDAAQMPPCCLTMQDRCAFRCTQRDDDPDVPATAFRQEPIVAALQKTLRNTAFTSLIPAAVLDMVAFTMIGTAMKLYVDYVVQPLDVPACETGSRTIFGFTSTLFCTSTDVWLGMALCALMVAMIVFIPVWQFFSVHLCGTRRAWLAMNLVGALTTGLFVFGGEGAPLPSVGLSFLNGAAQSALYLNDAVLAATIDYDAVINHGERAEARFAMFSSLTPKLASVPAQALPLSILAAIGFREPVRGVLQEQEDHVKSYISAIFFVIPTIITLTSWFIKLQFPIVHQEQLDRVAHEYRLCTGQVKPAWHEKLLMRDPLDPSLVSGGTRERPWCGWCVTDVVSQEQADARIAADRTMRRRGMRRVQSKAAIVPGEEKSEDGQDGDTMASVRQRRRQQQPAADGTGSQGSVGGDSSSGSSGRGPGSHGGGRPLRHTIRVYPRTVVTERDRQAFDVFDSFNVHELGAWRVFGLRFLREKVGRARSCRFGLALALGVAAAAQVGLGMLGQAALSWLPTVTFLLCGLTIGLAIVSHLKLRTCHKLNTSACGGPQGAFFARWLSANAMALRLNAIELELVDSSHSSAIREHEADDARPKPDGRERGAWDGRRRASSYISQLGDGQAGDDDAAPPSAAVSNGVARRASGPLYERDDVTDPASAPAPGSTPAPAPATQTQVTHLQQVTVERSRRSDPSLDLQDVEAADERAANGEEDGMSLQDDEGYDGIGSGPDSFTMRYDGSGSLFPRGYSSAEAKSSPRHRQPGASSVQSSMGSAGQNTLGSRMAVVGDDTLNEAGFGGIGGMGWRLPGPSVSAEERGRGASVTARLASAAQQSIV